MTFKTFQTRKKKILQAKINEIHRLLKKIRSVPFSVLVVNFFSKRLKS